MGRSQCSLDFGGSGPHKLFHVSILEAIREHFVETTEERLNLENIGLWFFKGNVVFP